MKRRIRALKLVKLSPKAEKHKYKHEKLIRIWAIKYGDRTMDTIRIIKEHRKVYLPPLQGQYATVYEVWGIGFVKSAFKLNQAIRIAKKYFHEKQRRWKRR